MKTQIHQIQKIPGIWPVRPKAEPELQWQSLEQSTKPLFPAMGHPFPWMNVRKVRQPAVQRLYDHIPSVAAAEIDPLQSRIIKIVFAPEDKDRIRKVITKSGTRSRIKCPSGTMSRMAHCRSNHERNAVVLMDASPHYKSFHEECVAIYYLLNGERFIHYPDFMVLGDGFREFWEVKEHADSLDPHVVRRTALMTAQLPEYGYRYRLVLAESLAEQPRLSNAETILRFRKAPSPTERERIRRRFQVRPSIPWDDVLDGFLGPEGRAHVFDLYLSSQLRFDIEKPMSGDSMITWGCPLNTQGVI